MALRGRASHQVGDRGESRVDKKTHVERQLYLLAQKNQNVKYPAVLNMDGDIVYQYSPSGEPLPQDTDVYAMNLIDIGSKISKLFSYGNITKIRITGLHRTIVYIQVLTQDYVLVFFMETEPITKALIDYDIIEEEVGIYFDRLVTLLS